MDLGTLVVNVVVKGEQAKKQMNSVANSTRRAGTDFRMLASVLRAVGGQFASATIYAAGLPGPLIAISVAVGTIVFALKKLVTFASDSFLKFEEAVTRAGMAAERITDSSMKSLGETIMDVAATTQFTTEEVAKSAKVWLQAGRAQADFERGGARAVSNLAAIAEISPEKAVTATVRMMEQFGAGVGHLERFNDVLAAVSTMTTATVSDLNQSMKFFGTTAAATNMSFEETVATMGRLRGVAEPGMLSRGLDVAMRKIINPTKAARQAIEELGLDVEELAKGSILDAANAFAKAGASYKDMTVIFSARAGRVMGSLLNIQKSGEPVEKLVAALSDKIDGLSAAMVKVSQTTIAKRWEILKSAAIKLGTAIGEKASPALRVFQSLLTKLIEEMSKPETQKALVQLVTGIYRLGAALVQGVIWAVKFYSALLNLIEKVRGLAEVLALVASPIAALFNMKFNFKVMEQEEVDIVKEAREELDKFKQAIEEAQAAFSTTTFDPKDMFQGDLDDFEAMTEDYKAFVKETQRLKSAAEARADAEERAKSELKQQSKTLSEMLRKYQILVALGPGGAGDFGAIFDLDDLSFKRDTEDFQVLGAFMVQAIGDEMEAGLKTLRENITLEKVFDIPALLDQLEMIGGLVSQETRDAVVEPLKEKVTELGSVQDGLIDQNRALLNIQADRVQEMTRLVKEEERAASALQAFNESLEAAAKEQEKFLGMISSVGSAVASGSSASVLGAAGSALSSLAGPMGPAIDAIVQLTIKLYEMAGIIESIDEVFNELLQTVADLVRLVAGPWIEAMLENIKVYLTLAKALASFNVAFAVLQVSIKLFATFLTYATRPLMWFATVLLDIIGFVSSVGGLLENDFSKNVKKQSENLKRAMREQDRAMQEMWGGARKTVKSMQGFRDAIDGESLESLKRRREEFVLMTTILATMGQLSRTHIDGIHAAIEAIDAEIAEREKATDSLREFNEEVNNLPSGYKKLKMRQLQAADGRWPGRGPTRGAGAGGDQPSWIQLPSRNASYGGRPTFNSLRRFNNIFAGATGEQ